MKPSCKQGQRERWAILATWGDLCQEG
jgi:hypothetical protein